MSLTKVTNSMILGSYANAADYGMSTTASADTNCAAVQAALMSGNTVVVVPPGSYSWNPAYMLYNDGTFSQATRTGISIPSGITLLGYGVTLISVNTNRNNYDMMASFKTTGVNIKGFTLIGDRDINTVVPTPGVDFGFGIDFRDVTNATVEDVISNKMYGDSFYLGVIDTAGTGSNRVTYRNIIGINSRRQGLSITGGQRIIVDGYRFENIVGASLGPCAGIDIEPNTTALCNDVQLLNGYVETSNRPIQVFKTSNLIINNLQVENCSILFPLLSDRVYDTSITNVVARGGGSSNYGILWQLSRTLVRVAISNCQIGVVNLFPFYMEEDTTGAYQWADVSINNCVFYVKDAPVSTSLADVTTYGAISFNNTVVIIPSTFAPADAVNLTGTNIINCENTIWQNCTINNLGTATLTANVGVFGNRGNVFSNVGFNEDYASLSNGWTTVGGYQQQSIIRDSNGEIRIYGVLTGGTRTAGTVFMTLPAGFRPELPQVCGITVDNAGTITAATVEVAVNGNVTFQYTIPANDEITLTSIRFLAGN
jgi:hypothetical protein